ncbi:MAG: TraB/GumN family protein [Gammaproteobacteria bacterium]|nr:TraB/GumN family protein [Gammaproteobacteria bacterium]
MSEPIQKLTLGDTHLTLLGTAHVSRASADAVTRELNEGDYDAVAVELCPSRYAAIVDPDAMARMDLFQVLREGKGTMVIASLALGAYQQRLAEQFGIEPGAEMRAAVDHALEHHKPVWLIDREVGTTLKRVYRGMPWWRRFELLSSLLASVVSKEEVREDEIERIKDGDMLESAFAQFADQERELFETLIVERDRYMAARILKEMADSDARNVLVVLGAGHLRGIDTELRGQAVGDAAHHERVIGELEHVPTGARWWRWLPWLIVALVLVGFGIGFQRSPELGWNLVVEWVLINGGLAALGALLALAHPLTVIGAFLAAPLTSLNPTVGAGMVTAGIEIWLRKPRVGDFSALRHDTTGLGGWWRNRVARTLLVFLFSTVGSAIGTYVAGYRIFDQLTGAS